MIASIKKLIYLSFFMILSLSHNTLSANSIRDDQENYDMRGQLYTPEGVRIGEPFEINSNTGTCDNPDIDPGGISQIIDQPKIFENEFGLQIKEINGHRLVIWPADEEEPKPNKPN